MQDSLLVALEELKKRNENPSMIYLVHDFSVNNCFHVSHVFHFLVGY